MMAERRAERQKKEEEQKTPPPAVAKTSEDLEADEILRFVGGGGCMIRKKLVQPLLSTFTITSLARYPLPPNPTPPLL